MVTGYTRNDWDELAVTSDGLNWEGGNKGSWDGVQVSGGLTV